MTEFEESLQLLASRNWPPERLQARFSETYTRALEAIELGDGEKIANIWRAVWQYESVIKGPETAFCRIESAQDKIPERDLFQIRSSYYGLANRPDLLRTACRDAIGAGQTVPLAYQTLILLECRTGNLDVAKDRLKEAVDLGTRGFLVQAINFSQMLGEWNLFQELVDRFAHDRTEPDERLVRWQAVSRWVSSQSDRAFPYAHRFVNLRRATGRRAALEKRYERYGIPLRFHEAVDGVEMSTDQYQKWCPDGTLHYGGVANLRSQHAVWCEFLASNESHMLVFEDDAWPYADLATWQDLTNLVDAEDPEIVFLNERGAGRWWLREHSSSGRPWVRYSEAIASYTDAMRAPGLDGYLVSRAGAEKLIENFEADGAVYNIDWQIAAYALSDEDHLTLPDQIQKQVIGNIYRRIKSLKRLDAFALERPVVCQFAAGHATVADTNRRVHLKTGL